MSCFIGRIEYLQSIINANLSNSKPRQTVGVNYLFSVLHLYLCGQSRVSLRLGHTRVLTCHRHVIHCARAASLRLSLQNRYKLPYDKPPFQGLFNVIQSLRSSASDFLFLFLNDQCYNCRDGNYRCRDRDDNDNGSASVARVLLI